jgi:hypothetical protein
LAAVRVEPRETLVAMPLRILASSVSARSTGIDGAVRVGAGRQ